MARPKKNAHKVRADQAHEGDRPGQHHRPGRQHARDHKQQRPQQGHVHAQAHRLGLGKTGHVHGAAHQRQQRDAGERDERHQQNRGPIDRFVEITHHPVGEVVAQTAGADEVIEQHDQGAVDGRQHDAGEQQPQRVDHASLPPDEIDHAHAQQRSDQRSDVVGTEFQLQPVPQQRLGHDAHGRAAGQAEDERLGQRITQQRLQRHA